MCPHVVHHPKPTKNSKTPTQCMQCIPSHFFSFHSLSTFSRLFLLSLVGVGVCVLCTYTYLVLPVCQQSTVNSHSDESSPLLAPLFPSSTEPTLALSVTCKFPRLSVTSTFPSNVPPSSNLYFFRPPSPDLTLIHLHPSPLLILLLLPPKGVSPPVTSTFPYTAPTLVSTFSSAIISPSSLPSPKASPTFITTAADSTWPARQSHDAH